MNPKTQAQVDKLKAGISTMVEGDEWKAYLDLQKRFYSYSFGNCMLMAFEAELRGIALSRVAGFNRWKKLGRSVKKGEKGIGILAPCTFKREQEDGTTRMVLGGFRVVYVFDVSQTEGEELPEAVRMLTGGGDVEIEAFDWLAKWSKDELGIPVSLEEDTHGANGYLTLQAPYRIVVKASNDPLQRLKTLAHELGHALLHLHEADRHGRAVREVEAESVAYIILGALGVDTSAYSFGYIAGWAGETEGSSKVEDILKTGERVQKAAKRVLMALEAHLDEQAA